MDTPVRIIGELVLDLRKANQQLRDFASQKPIRFQLANEAKAVSQIQKVGNEAKRATGKAESFTDALNLKTRQLGIFSIAASAVAKVTFELAKATREAIRFEQELVRLSQVFDSAATGNDNLSQSIRGLARQYGLASVDIAKVGVILGQTGLTARETQSALEALTRTTLAATFGTLEQTTEGAVAIMNQFNIEAGELGETLDIVNSVSKQFAVESGDIIEAVKRSGGAFESAGGSFKEFVALFTSVRSTTRETADTIGTGFRTIFARLQRPKVIDYFRELGIELETVDGNFVGPLEAVQRISTGLERLGIRPGQTRFAEIVEQLGGLRQVSRVIPLLSQTAKTEEALAIAGEAVGSTSRDAAKAQETLAVQLARVREEFSALIFEISQTSTFKEIASLMLNIASAAISLTRSVKELIPLFVALGGLKLGKAFAGGTPKSAGVLSGAPINFVGSQFAALPRLSTGAKVPGIGITDSVLAALTPGEVVLNRRQQNILGRITGSSPAALFRSAGVPGFNQGGVVGGGGVGRAAGIGLGLLAVQWQFFADETTEAGKAAQFMGESIIGATTSFLLLKGILDGVTANGGAVIASFKAIGSGKTPIRNLISSAGAANIAVGAFALAAGVASAALQAIARDLTLRLEAAVESGDQVQAGELASQLKKVERRSPITTGLKFAAAGAGVGTAFGGPVGALAGGAIAGIVGIIAEATGQFDDLNPIYAQLAKRTKEVEARISRLTESVTALGKASQNRLRDLEGFASATDKLSFLKSQTSDIAGTQAGNTNIAALERRRQRNLRQADTARALGDSEQAEDFLKLADANAEEIAAKKKALAATIDLTEKTLSAAKAADLYREVLLDLNDGQTVGFDDRNLINRNTIKAGSKLEQELKAQTALYGDAGVALRRLSDTILKTADVVGSDRRIREKAFSLLGDDLEVSLFGSIEEKIDRISGFSSANTLGNAVAAGNLRGIGLGQRGGFDFLQQSLGTGLQIFGKDRLTAEQVLFGRTGQEEKSLTGLNLKKNFAAAGVKLGDEEIRKAVVGIRDARDIDQALLDVNRNQETLLQQIAKGMGIDVTPEPARKAAESRRGQLRDLIRDQFGGPREGDVRRALLAEVDRTGTLTAQSGTAAIQNLPRATVDVLDKDGNVVDVEANFRLIREMLPQLEKVMADYKTAVEGQMLAAKESKQAAELIPSQVVHRGHLTVEGGATPETAKAVEESLKVPKLAPESAM